jgi:signal transduction histidine kinase
MVLLKKYLSLFAVILLPGLGPDIAAAAKITCCDVNNQRVCGDPPPSQCLHKSKTVFKKGVAHEVEAPLTVEQKAAREAAAVRKLEEEKLADEQARRDRALMESYTSEKDIDLARDRALADIEKNASQATARLESALKRQKKLELDKEFYQKKPLPVQLQAQIRDNNSEIAMQEKALREKDESSAAIRTRFDADKARYRQISRGAGRTTQQ